jgi:undecaprenyl diphosphate synthase
MKVTVIGERSKLDSDIVDKIIELEECSKNNTGIHFIIALNYGSRDEITRTVKKIAIDCKKDKLNPENITEDTISSYLDTAGVPDPDLLIRTSGELRLSNYLLWQLAYTEFYFTDVLWPDFDAKELKKAIAYYNTRDRRYGGVK